jgi:hypothetical protein
MDLIDTLPRAPLALGALWLLSLAWLLNNSGSLRRQPAGSLRPAVPAEDHCPFCRVAYDQEGPLCWCDQAECWR